MNENELKKIGEEVGRYLGEGIAGGLSDSSKIATKDFMKDSSISEPLT